MTPKRLILRLSIAATATPKRVHTPQKGVVKKKPLSIIIIIIASTATEKIPREAKSTITNIANTAASINGTAVKVVTIIATIITEVLLHLHRLHLLLLPTLLLILPHILHHQASHIQHLLLLHTQVEVEVEAEVEMKEKTKRRNSLCTSQDFRPALRKVRLKRLSKPSAV